MSEPFIGQIIMFAGNFAPRGWALCNGQFLQISENTALFSILGTTYGGDGRTTYALPDLRGRVALHPGTGVGLSTYDLGQGGGVESVTLNAANLPAHSHNVSVTTPGQAYTTQIADEHEMGNGVYPAVTPQPAYAADSEPSTIGGGTNVLTTTQAGSNTAITNLQPYRAVNYIIALVGIFPSRN